MTGVVLLAVILGWSLLFASVIAATINAPISPSLRFILVVVLVAAAYAIKILSDLRDRLDTLARWTRLTFITVHIRNEQDGLERAMDRY